LEKPVQGLQGFSPPDLQFPAGNRVFIPEVFHHGDKPPLFGIKIAVEFVGEPIVEFFQDEFAGIGLDELRKAGLKLRVSIPL
jgi:hypothetical protein